MVVEAVGRSTTVLKNVDKAEAERIVFMVTGD
jgi:hypothetical protein